MSEVPLYFWKHDRGKLMSSAGIRKGGCAVYRGTSLMRNNPPPAQDHHRPLGVVLLYGARGLLSLTSEVPLYRGTSLIRNRCPLGPYRRPILRVLGGS